MHKCGFYCYDGMHGIRLMSFGGEMAEKENIQREIDILTRQGESLSFEVIRVFPAREAGKWDTSEPGWSENDGSKPDKPYIILVKEREVKNDQDR